MEWIKNLKIAHKLLLTLIVALFFSTIVGCVGFYYSWKTSTELSTLYNNCLTPIRDLSKVIINSNANNTLLLAMLSSDSTAEKNEFKQSIKENGDENSKLLDDYENSKISDKERSIYEGMAASRGQYRDSRKKLMALSVVGKGEEGARVYRNETRQITTL